MIENALIDLALLETDRLESGHQVLVPYSSCLFLAIDVPEYFEDMCSLLCPWYFESLWDLHVQVICFSLSLSVGHDKVNLLHVPVVDDR